MSALAATGNDVMGIGATNPAPPVSGGRVWQLTNPTLVLLAILVSFLIIHTWQDHWQQSPGIDFYQFWVVPQALAQLEVTNLYGPEDQNRIHQ